ncbi:elongation of very long chain fatty acids protein 4-like [Tropilaelaps mercedesae]|uniref:Elongation of very long chain fatty acids protein n=1 Tax=Tropilaelaps mercedesae TaxID=418985 RepID=A0A1V9X406_9ACAR|nr:elongation of very long chain fatty acids protein 4-like [Tropilaelaps mercedesae]
MDLMAAFPREKRIKGILFDNPSMVLVLIASYMAFVLKLGPVYMRRRKPYNLRLIMRIYNLSQMVANVWFCYQAIELAWRYRNLEVFHLPCLPPTTEIPDLEGPGDTEHLIFFSVAYFYVRVLDLLDTVFFVLAKKFSHVSFLHVYHHVVVVTTAYVYLRSGWGNVLYYVSILNSMVHIVMYFYYFLSTFPSMKPYLFWKRYLTALQIVQFLIVGVRMTRLTMNSCGIPKIVLQYNISQVVIFIAMFTRFYLRNYANRTSDNGRCASNAKQSSLACGTTTVHINSDIRVAERGRDK